MGDKYVSYSVKPLKHNFRVMVLYSEPVVSLIYHSLIYDTYHSQICMQLVLNIHFRGGERIPNLTFQSHQKILLIDIAILKNMCVYVCPYTHNNYI